MDLSISDATAKELWKLLAITLAYAVAVGWLLRFALRRSED